MRFVIFIISLLSAFALAACATARAAPGLDANQQATIPAQPLTTPAPQVTAFESPKDPVPEVLVAPPSYTQASFPSFSLPDANPPPFGPGLSSGNFRDPLPPSPVWNPRGPKRVGLQAGHWLTYETPAELRRLGPGASAGGWAEWEVNLLVARATARFLEEAGVEVDLLPTTIPVRYRAHAFVSIHADGDTAGAFRGYKLTRPGFSSIPEVDDLFVRTLYDEYGAVTGLPRDSDAHISRRMTFYYAFNTRRYQHAIDVGMPSAIIEAGFLTHPTDRAFLTSQPDVAGRGLANGILKFLALELGADAFQG